ncbi:hypothetical protein QC761_605830 [Podospora bellae-mahoneyi]|uniref:Uncharacterized protein n=1 Tax=Podospora bellae-mahoneyi TaxID=2093777 RepID=A0ABR0FAA4_9PEZI|nr:hypothetical protein QC761_605830 [Podospora bellae-mahoneyi]
MSMFSFIRKGRQAAKEHKAEKAEKAKREAEKPPYRHIPKHAAIDAVSSGPAGWRSEDRQKIVDQNKRRSAMTTSGMNMTGQPRIHSSLSHVSFPAAFATPVVPRTYSYSSMPAGWASGDMNYSNVDVSSSSVKGKEVDRSTSASLYLSRSAARLSAGRYPMNMNAVIGTGDLSISPVDSSSNSTSSQDDLEMEPIKHASLPPVTSKTRGYSRPMSDSGSIHRLHPARRLSDAEQNTTPHPGPSAHLLLPTHELPPRRHPPRPSNPGHAIRRRDHNLHRLLHHRLGSQLRNHGPHRLERFPPHQQYQTNNQKRRRTPRRGGYFPDPRTLQRRGSLPRRNRHLPHHHLPYQEQEEDVQTQPVPRAGDDQLEYFHRRG